VFFSPYPLLRNYPVDLAEARHSNSKFIFNYPNALPVTDFQNKRLPQTAFPACPRCTIYLGRIHRDPVKNKNGLCIARFLVLP
jgi:hypothetical protein